MTSLGLFQTKPLRNEDVPLGSYLIHFEVHGTENPIGRIVFVMGMMASMGGWNEFLNRFADKYQMLVLDNRGYGLSTPGSFERYTTSGMAKDVIAVMDYIGWTENQSIHLVGISMGGMIAQHISLAIPSRILTLTLLTTCATHRAPKENPYVSLQVIKPQPSVDAKIKNLMSMLFGDEAWLDSFDPTYPQYRDNRERMYRTIEHRMSVVPQPSFRTLFGQGFAVLTHHINPNELKEIGSQMKVLVITGTKDMMIEPDCSKHIAEHTGGKLVLLPGRGHGLPLESTVEVIKELEILFGMNKFDS
jgi:pimeloyl-ACP methyl ester carboxylesterase